MTQNSYTQGDWLISFEQLLRFAPLVPARTIFATVGFFEFLPITGFT